MHIYFYVRACFFTGIDSASAEDVCHNEFCCIFNEQSDTIKMRKWPELNSGGGYLLWSIFFEVLHRDQLKGFEVFQHAGSNACEEGATGRGRTNFILSTWHSVVPQHLVGCRLFPLHRMMAPALV